MEHLAVKAVTAITDLGEFEALAATYDIDRVKDKIIFGAFEKTIAEWQASGKLIPVDWAHSNAAQDLIGSVKPATMREIPGQGLYVEGQLDLQGSEVAREAWRAMKAKIVALSFGYLVPEGGAKKRRDGTNELREIDLFAITVATRPINPKTRFLSLKAATAERSVPTDSELRRQWEELKPTLPAPRLPAAKLREKAQRLCAEIAIQDIPRSEPKVALPTAAEQRREWDRLRVELAVGNLDLDAIKAAREPERVVPTMDQLRDQARELGLPVPPPRPGTAEWFRDDMLRLLNSR